MAGPLEMEVTRGAMLFNDLPTLVHRVALGAACEASCFFVEARDTGEE